MTAENKPLPAIPAKRYFTIGEVSELCGVKAYVLRYWEQEFTQLKPVKRRGNRRYYQHHEVLLIRRIRDLLYEQGFTISGARNQLHEAGVHAHARADAADGEPFDADELEGEGTAAKPRDPGTRTRASDVSQAAVAVRDKAAESTDTVARTGAVTLDDAALDAMARDDVATIERARAGRAEVETPVAAVSQRPASNAAASARTAAPQARKSAGSTSAPSSAGPSYDTEQIRTELLAIRALLVS